MGQHQLLVPRTCSILEVPAVRVADERLKLMEQWVGGTISRYKSEWFTEECRTSLRGIQSDLEAVLGCVENFRHDLKRKDTKTFVMTARHLRLSKTELSDIKDFVDMMNMGDDIPTVVLIGFKDAKLAVPLRLWANVLIVSPKLTANVIDLSAEGQAPPREPLRARPGEDGLHGRPGKYGGNLGVVCRELVHADLFLELSKSSGQRGGIGQCAGHGINGADAMYDVSEFTESLKQLSKCLPTFNDWSSTLDNKLPDEIHLENQTVKTVPLDVSHVIFAGAGTAVAATAVTVSCFLPFVAPIVAPTMLPVASGLIGGVFVRNTQIELKLSRSSEQGKCGISPGCRGRGGCGGFGGLFHVIEDGQEVKMWRGDSGQDGEAGSFGDPSCNGIASISVKGTLLQEFGASGQQRGEPVITVAPENPKPAKAQITQYKFTDGQPAFPSNNPLDPIQSVLTHYEEAFSELAKRFPQCDFSNVKLQWTSASARA